MSVICLLAIYRKKLYNRVMPFAMAGLLVALGLLPSLIWMFLFLKEDCHPEPRYLLTKTFLMGIIISPLAILLQLAFSRIGSLGPIDYFIVDGSLFFLWAAFVEEFLKYYAVKIVALNDSSFDEPVDAMIYMMMAGLGFAAIENILVLFRTIPNGISITVTVWTLRSLGATLLHALSSGLLGYFLALSWFFQDHRKKLVVIGVLVSTLFHFTFNIFLAGSDNQIGGLLFSVGTLCVMALLVSLLFARMRHRSPNAIPKLTAATEKEISIT
ncbi:MAG: PrsW family intramembrane metalloprotease [Candidatus Pacebacteria bacterium]|nr:PrsW family intramembrane metalloprotease [Candidatus Paceibacterota bacterium]